MTVKDANKSTIKEEFSISVYPVSIGFHPEIQKLSYQVNTTTLPDAYVGMPIDFSIGPVGGIEPYELSIRGKLPQGINFQDGHFWGIPQTPQDEFNFERIKALLSIYTVLIEKIFQGQPHYRILSSIS